MFKFPNTLCITWPWQGDVANSYRAAECTWSLSKNIISKPSRGDEVLLTFQLKYLSECQLKHLDRRIERLTREILQFQQYGPVKAQYNWPSRDLTSLFGRPFPRYWDTVLFNPGVIALGAISSLISTRFWQCESKQVCSFHELLDAQWRISLCGLAALNVALLCDCTAQLARRRRLEMQGQIFAYNAAKVRLRIQKEIEFRQSKK